MSPTSSQETASISTIQDASPMFVPLKELELLSKMTTGGLQVLYRYTRKPHLFSASMTSIQLTLNNLGQNDLNDIKIGTKTLAPGMALHDFPCKLVKANFSKKPAKKTLVYRAGFFWRVSFKKIRF